MNTPVNHHYIPQMLSKRFTNQEGKLYVFDKIHPERGIQKKNPKKVFVKRRLYTQMEKDGTRDASVETELLARLESEASPVIEKIVTLARQSTPPTLSSDEQDIWVKFFFIQFSRVPDTLDPATDKVRQIVRAKNDFAGQSRPLNDLELSVQNNPETMERHLTNGRIQNLQLSPSSKVPAFLREMQIIIAVVRKLKPERNFLIGSNPIVKLATSVRSFIADPSAEVWLPLARDVAVSICPRESDRIISANDGHIRTFNKSIFQQSTVIAGCSRELIESLLGEETKSIRSRRE